jgi:hypothetical protein
MKRREPQFELQNDVERRQRNTVWPDVLKNSVTVDGFLWHGSPNATVVQRIAAAIFGCCFISGSTFLLTLAIRDHSEIVLVNAIIFLLIGWKVFANAIPNKQKVLLLRPLAVVFGFFYVVVFLAWPLLRG